MRFGACEQRQNITITTHGAGTCGMAEKRQLIEGRCLLLDCACGLGIS